MPLGEEASQSIGVAVVEDNRLFRDMLRELVDRANGMHCVFAAGSCEAALDAVRDGAAPNVVIMDLELPGISGIEGIARLRPLCPAAEFIVLTIHDGDERVFDSICAGATGYLIKPASAEAITDGIRTVAAGGSSIDGFIARRVIQAFRVQSKKREVGLTTREQEILGELANGSGLKEIAAAFGLSRHTVDSHVRNIYAKLQVHSRAAAVAKALRNRIL